jgi:hypothetical protein
MNKVLNFPKKFVNPDSLDESKHYRIPLYSEDDVNMVLFCLNAFGDTDARFVRDDLARTDPLFVAKCLDTAYKSDIITVIAKSHIKAIRDSVHEVSE